MDNQDVVKQFTVALDLFSGVVENLACKDTEKCDMKFGNLEEQVDENRRAIFGKNGDTPGILTAMGVMNERVKSIDDGYKNLRNLLVGVLISLLLTFATAGLNLLITLAQQQMPPTP